MKGTDTGEAFIAKTFLRGIARMEEIEQKKKIAIF